MWNLFMFYPFIVTTGCVLKRSNKQCKFNIWNDLKGRALNKYVQLVLGI